jgi:hypothetical protein
MYKPEKVRSTTVAFITLGFIDCTTFSIHKILNQNIKLQNPLENLQQIHYKSKEIFSETGYLL